MSEPTKPPLSSYLRLVMHLHHDSRVCALPVDGAVSIGRSSSNTLVIAEPYIAERHATVFSSAGRVTVENLADDDIVLVRTTSSSPPVFAALTKYQRVALRVGDRLQLGPVVVCLEASAGRAPALPRQEPHVVLDTEMIKLNGLAARAAATDLPVLILGESGVGKEVFARIIHDQSPRAGAPFTPLLEPGAGEANTGGTVFFDEIGELTLMMQAKLLASINEQQARASSSKGQRVDYRLVCATRHDLKQQCES